jgi:hypothetical protein
MSGLFRSVRSALLNHLFGKATMTPPAIYLGLSSTTPNSDGSNISEPTEGGYARVATSAGDWSVAVDGDPCVITNTAQFTFPRALGNWAGGEILTDGVLFDSPSGGAGIGAGTLKVQKPVFTDDTAQYPAGSITITMGGSA